MSFGHCTRRAFKEWGVQSGRHAGRSVPKLRNLPGFRLVCVGVVARPPSPCGLRRDSLRLTGSELAGLPSRSSLGEVRERRLARPAGVDSCDPRLRRRNSEEINDCRSVTWRGCHVKVPCHPDSIFSKGAQSPLFAPLVLRHWTRVKAWSAQRSPDGCRAPGATSNAATDPPPVNVMRNSC
jgi:hypothetical protein